MFRTPAALFRVLAIAEACSWTLLIAALIIRFAGGPALAVTIGGSVHGFVFLSYAAVALLVALHNRWGIGMSVLAVGAAVIPYATIPVEIRLARAGRLAGHWRFEETDDPRDRTVIDRLLRWFLRHATLLVALLAVGIIAVYAILLIVGPPGGRH